MSMTSNPRAVGFAARLEHARASGRPLLDLTESDPSCCGLAWDPAELEAILSDRRDSHHQPAPGGLVEAREAVSSYLAGRGASVPPDRVFLTLSRNEAYLLLLKLLCGPDDEVLVASPSYPFLDRLAASESVRVGRYGLIYDGEWRLDRKSLRKAIGRRTCALVVGNPSDPTGATLSRGDLAFLEDLCSTRGIALVGDEAFADTALAPCATVAEVRQCLAVHVSGLSGVCGLPRFAEWLAVAGPDGLVGPALSRLELLADVQVSLSDRLQLALPALLARREPFLKAQRARLAENRTSLATAALREAPWSLQWGRGGCWAVLQIGGAEEEESLCLALLEDGVAVQPGFFHGLPRHGYLTVSLLPTPEIFGEGLARLDRRLRAPLSG
jgi:aspartate/methionine/tyrosine aminotransferase